MCEVHACVCSWVYGVCVCMCVSLHGCVRVFTCLHVSQHLCLCECVFMFMCVCMCVFTSVSVCARTCAYVHVCMLACVYVSTCAGSAESCLPLIRTKSIAVPLSTVTWLHNCRQGLLGSAAEKNGWHKDVRPACDGSAAVLARVRRQGQPHHQGLPILHCDPPK